MWYNIESGVFYDIMTFRRETMTIALVDDSDSDIELLHDYLSRYCHDHHVYDHREIYG